MGRDSALLAEKAADAWPLAIVLGLVDFLRPDGHRSAVLLIAAGIGWGAFRWISRKRQEQREAERRKLEPEKSVAEIWQETYGDQRRGD